MNQKNIAMDENNNLGLAEQSPYDDFTYRVKLTRPVRQVCGHCEYEVILHWSVGLCPFCGKVIVACDACDLYGTLPCLKCTMGNRFRETNPSDIPLPVLKMFQHLQRLSRTHDLPCPEFLLFFEYENAVGSLNVGTLWMARDYSAIPNFHLLPEYNFDLQYEAEDCVRSQCSQLPVVFQYPKVRPVDRSKRKSGLVHDCSDPFSINVICQKTPFGKLGKYEQAFIRSAEETGMIIEAADGKNDKWRELIGNERFAGYPDMHYRVRWEDLVNMEKEK